MKVDDYLPANVAPPRSVFGTGTYTGAELTTRPTREGATDAAKIPSLINGRRIEPAELRAQLAAPIPGYEAPPAAPAPLRMPKPLKPGRRARSSIPAEHRTVKPLADFPKRERQVREPRGYKPRGMAAPLIERLTAEGGYMTLRDIAEAFDMNPNGVGTCLRKPIMHGLLKYFRLGPTIGAVSLPGYEPTDLDVEAERRKRNERQAATRRTTLADPFHRTGQTP